METVLVNGAILVLGLALSVMTARSLGPQGRGIYSLALTITGLVSLVTGLGLQQALAYHLAREPGRAADGLGVAILGGAAVGSVATVVSLVVTYSVANGDVRDATIVGLLVTVPSLISGNLVGVLQGLQRLRRFNALRLAPPTAITAFVAVWVLAGSLTPTAAVAMQVVGVLAATVFGYALVRPIARMRVPNLRWVVSLVRYGAIVNLGSIAYTANRQLSILVLAAIGTLQDVGKYSVAAGYGLPVMIVPTAIALLALPRVASEPDPQAQGRVARRQVLLAWLATLPLALIAVLLAPVAVPLAFGREFSHAVAISQVLAGASALLGVSHVLAEICRGLGRPAMPPLAEATALIFSLGLMMLVVPRYGALGAAIVALGTYGLVCAILSLVVHSLVRPLADAGKNDAA